MKKTFFIGLFFLSYMGLSAQNVFVQTQTNNASSQQTQDGTFSINGISSREDIGGVEITRERIARYTSNYRLVFENYNNVDVTVLYQVHDYRDGNVTGSVVLRAGEKKALPVEYIEPTDFKLIVRQMGGMAQSSSSSTGISSVPQLVAGYLYVAPDHFENVTYREALELRDKMNSYGYCDYSDWRLPTSADVEAIRSAGIIKNMGEVWNSKHEADYYNYYYYGNGKNDHFALVLVRYK